MCIRDRLWDAFKAVVDFIADNFPGMQKTVETIFGGIGKAVEGVFGIFKTLIDWVGKALDAWKKWIDRPADKSGSGGNGGISEGLRDYIPSRKSGTHRNGLDYVPYDGYIAELHKGERVLTAKEAAQGQTMNHSGIIKVEGVNSNNELMGVVDIVMDQLRREVRTA